MPSVSRTNLTRATPICLSCGTPTEDLDENDECFECADVPELDLESTPICYECGNDIGPYDGLCLDCLEARDG